MRWPRGRERVGRAHHVSPSGTPPLKSPAAQSEPWHEANSKDDASDNCSPTLGPRPRDLSAGVFHVKQGRRRDRSPRDCPVTLTSREAESRSRLATRRHCSPVTHAGREPSRRRRPSAGGGRRRGQTTRRTPASFAIAVGGRSRAAPKTSQSLGAACSHPTIGSRPPGAAPRPDSAPDATAAETGRRNSVPARGVERGRPAERPVVQPAVRCVSRGTERCRRRRAGRAAE